MTEEKKAEKAVARKAVALKSLCASKGQVKKGEEYFIARLESI